MKVLIRILVIIISLITIWANIGVCIIIMQGYFAGLFSDLDSSPPLNLPIEPTTSIIFILSLIIIIVSTIWSIYSIFAARPIKQILIPTSMTIFMYLILMWFQPNYEVINESKYPKNEFYYWRQVRKYKHETKIIQWKRPKKRDEVTRFPLESPWELDTLIIVKD